MFTLKQCACYEKGFILVFVSPYCNKQCQLERAHDLVISFQRQKNYLTDFHLNNLRYLRHLRDKNYSHADNRVRQESVFICGICGTKKIHADFADCADNTV